MVLLKSVPIRDGKLYQGTIGEKMKQELLVMHSAILMVYNVDICRMVFQSMVFQLKQLHYFVTAI